MRWIKKIVLNYKTLLVTLTPSRTGGKECERKSIAKIALKATIQKYNKLIFKHPSIPYF